MPPVLPSSPGLEVVQYPGEVSVRVVLGYIGLNPYFLAVQWEGSHQVSHSTAFEEGCQDGGVAAELPDVLDHLHEADADDGSLEWNAS